VSTSPWQPPPKPGEITEERLIRAILDRTFPVNSNLPGERELARLLGVTRPTLREAMQRMERDGWLDIQHGKPTRVRDFWKEGNFGVSIALARHMEPLPADYAANLLEVRVLLCPTYTRKAIENERETISELLSKADSLERSPEAYATYDWELHWQLTVSSGNPFFTHFINNVHGLYDLLGVRYFSYDITRQHSAGFYEKLKPIASKGDAEAAEALALRVMRESLALWKEISG
jgi:GntR family transcriptional regulator, negative regulator for fad regulon and positive regulator of fabA